MRRKGFTLLELAVVIVILGILLALGIGYFGKYRKATALNTAADRLVSEIQNAQAAARTNGLVQLRSGAALGALNPAVTEPAANGVILAQIVQKTSGKPSQITREWFVGDMGGQGVQLNIQFSNLPLAPINTATAGDQGVNLELAFQAATNTPMASLAFDPDGRVHTMSAAQSGYIYLGTDAGQYLIEISPIGKVSKTRTQ